MNWQTAKFHCSEIKLIYSIGCSSSPVNDHGENALNIPFIVEKRWIANARYTRHFTEYKQTHGLVFFFQFKLVWINPMLVIVKVNTQSKIWVNGQTRRLRNNNQTDGQTLPNILSPCFIINKNMLPNTKYISLRVSEKFKMSAL